MKRLITCSDGTWNKPGEKDGKVEANTNVYKIFECVSETAQQRKFYDKGVGTRGIIDRILGGITGEGIDGNIKDVYRFLVENYDRGVDEASSDKIYLFGFSRGAYTARSVAGLIRNCGILKREGLSKKQLGKKINEVFEIYRDRSDETHPASAQMISMKAENSYEPIIKFIGVWDTVGSLGIPLSLLHKVNTERYKFHDTTLTSWVENAYHALAIDERRYLFEPTLWDTSKTVKDNPTIQKMEQRWFTGVHSNIGGGYADCGLSDLALQWLIDKAKATGLQFEDAGESQKTNCNYGGVLRDSYTSEYKLWSPAWRAITPGNKDSNQVISDSVWERYDNDITYKPENLNGLRGK